MDSTDKINQMSEDFMIENDEYQIWSMNVSKKKDYEEQWAFFKQNSCVSIDYFLVNKNNDYSSFSNKNDIQEFLEDNIHEGSIEPDLINRFVNRVDIGDIFIVHKGNATLAGIGIINSDYIYREDSLKHIRKVKWIYTPDNLVLKDGSFFKTSNIVRLDEDYSRFINEIMARIAGKDKNVRKRLFDFIFKKYYTNYCSTDKGREHFNEYDVEEKYINHYWSIIDEKASKNQYFADDIWDNIFNRQIGVLRVGVNNLRNLNQKKYDFTDEEMVESAILFYNTVNSIINTANIDEQKKILRDFSYNKLSKGFGVGRLSPILFYLNDSFYPINKKSILTFRFLSLALGDENRLSTDLNEYIDNNEKYKNLLINLRKEFSCDKFNIEDLREFDEFCHWICSVDDYLWSKDGKILPISILSDNLQSGVDESKIFKSNEKRNIIYFGAPGTGKSFNLNRDKDILLKNHEDNFERVTFHPDYSYANFVGTYKPVPENNTITYKYVPGPFMRVLKKASDNPSVPFLLIIEEINRANVAAVFGDVFQLLDRQDNESMYPIDATEDMKTYLNQDKIKIPQNMFIWATMNSADQGVFPMDTAFKRRWDFRYFSINNNDELIGDTFVRIGNFSLNWNALRKAINNQLLSYKLNEDKLIGPFFAFNEYHSKEIPVDVFRDIFKNKIVMYLFEDAARAKRNELFSGACEICATRNITYSQICDLIDKDKIIEIFAPDIRDLFFINEE